MIFTYYDFNRQFPGETGLASTSCFFLPLIPEENRWQKWHKFLMGRMS